MGRAVKGCLPAMALMNSCNCGHLVHPVALEYKMRMKTRPGIEAFQELSWLHPTSSISSLPPSFMSNPLNWGPRIRLISMGQIEVDSETIFKLAALVLQESKGDYASDENARKDLKTLPVFPTKTLQEHPSLAYCEDRVIEHYLKIKGLTRGQAVVHAMLPSVGQVTEESVSHLGIGDDSDSKKWASVRYMKIVEALPTYGVHYYAVKDKQGLPWWLGISYKGIGQYDLQDKVKPRKSQLHKNRYLLLRTDHNQACLFIPESRQG
ncbi:hypothetical protein STEG23_032437, partial [Scotinomys teguina]